MLGQHAAVDSRLAALQQRQPGELRDGIPRRRRPSRFGGPGSEEGALDGGLAGLTTSADNTNILFLTEDRSSRSASYLGRSKEVFKCPSDRYLSAAQRAKGWMQRARSYSVNIAVADGNAEAGPWEPIYRHVRKNSDLIIPGPGQTYVFVDEHPDSMNDPGLFNPHQTSWIDQRHPTITAPPVSHLRTAIRRCTNG